MSGSDPATVPVVRTDVVVRPDVRRVVARLFLPGQEVTSPGNSRAADVAERCLAMTDEEATAAFEEVVAEHSGRHRRFLRILDEHFDAVAHRVDGAQGLSTLRRRLIGAYFTQEYALEGAALFNPSLVVHPEQGAADSDSAGPDAEPGDADVRFVMSARAVGEGHLSSITFRSGVFTVSGPGGPAVVLDEGSTLATAGTRQPGMLHAARVAHEARTTGADDESLRFVLDGLPEHFLAAAVENALEELGEQRLTRVNADRTITAIRRAADASYEVSFEADTDLSERTLMPGAEAESHGMEDARFVRFTEDDGGTTYLATYTAFDGAHVTSARIQTDDFRTFRMEPLTGRASANKGMALFPRRVGGRYLALSRWDRENNALAFSDDGYHWADVVGIQSPRLSWDLVQLGNCGPPLELPQGWLVLTHGVGPVRRYSMGAMLLDLDDPTRVLGVLPQRLLRPTLSERDGYVPNVVYSCGALVSGEFLLLPYGCSDASIRMAFVRVADVLDRLRPVPRE
jgi:predicted GH43/DUF377 family glycosyl hydrolase